MRKTVKGILIAAILPFFFSPCLAQNSQVPKWEQDFVYALEQIRTPAKTDGLGFTLSEDEALEQAIKTAMEQGAPACQALKLAVERNFNPYTVLTGLFNSRAKIDLNDLCMCATETGDINLPKSLMAQAAEAAVAANMITREEVTQAQCLRQGLGFTPEEAALERGDQKEKEDPYSKSVPG